MDSFLLSYFAWIVLAVGIFIIAMVIAIFLFACLQEHNTEPEPGSKNFSASTNPTTIDIDDKYYG